MENSENILPKFVKCPHCNTKLELEESERKNNRFLCPKCNKYNSENRIINITDTSEEKCRVCNYFVVDEYINENGFCNFHKKAILANDYCKEFIKKKIVEEDKLVMENNIDEKEQNTIDLNHHHSIRLLSARRRESRSYNKKLTLLSIILFSIPLIFGFWAHNESNKEFARISWYDQEKKQNMMRIYRTDSDIKEYLELEKNLVTLKTGYKTYDDKSRYRLLLEYYKKRKNKISALWFTSIFSFIIAVIITYYKYKQYRDIKKSL